MFSSDLAGLLLAWEAYISPSVPVALGTFLQTGDDDLSTHEAGAASGTGRNVQLGSKIVLHKDLLFM